MRCKHCGSENTNDAKFCEFCGNSLEEPVQEAYGESTSQEIYEDPSGDTYRASSEKAYEEEENACGSAPFGEEAPYEEPQKEEDKDEIYSGEVIDSHSSEYKEAKPDSSCREYTVKCAAVSGLRSAYMLIATILLGAQVILMLMCAFSPVGAYVASFIGPLYFFKRPILVFRIIVCIAAAIEAVLFTGFAMTFISALGKKDICKTAGLTILQIMCAAGVIIVCLGFLCAVGAALVLSRYYMVVYGVSFSLIGAGVMAGGAAAAFILVLLFFIKLLRTVGKAKKAAAYGIAKKNVSLYCAVVLFIIAAVILAVCVASLFTWIPASLFLNTAELCLAAACVLYGIFIINFRKKMKEVL